ncbi:remorin-like isoform X2 [Punica granatum]|nr:remorin-like isoform X2 [Punica granatum]XP_031386319.1 remorin-like isoform X2 [Punica granatum]
MSRSSSRPQRPVDELEATAVAAAAFAVNATLEDSIGPTSQKSSTTVSPEASSLAKAKSRKDKGRPPPEHGASPSRSSGEGSKLRSQGSPETKPPSSHLQRRPTFADHLADRSDSRSPKIPTPPSPPPPPPPPPPRPSQSIKKTATPSAPVTSRPIKPEPSFPKPSKPPTSQAQPKAASRPASRGGTKADVWEATEMEKIRERYEKLNATIASWEEGKKKKAKAKLDKTESEVARRRAKAMEKFREEMESINQIAGGARAEAQKRQKNEELKAKEKANKYRRTGKFPRTCFCF